MCCLRTAATASGARWSAPRSTTRARGGLRTLTLTVTAGNLAATALYQAAGFTAFGTEPFAVRALQGYLDKVHMWLDLHVGAPPWHVE